MLAESIINLILMMQKRENIMNFLRIKMFILCAIAFIAFGITGCKQEGTAEKAGKEVDKSIESAKEKLEEVTK